MKHQTKLQLEIMSTVFCVAGLSIFMIGFFIIAGKCDLSVILGTIAGSAASMLNYYLQILTVKIAVNYERDKAVIMSRLLKVFRMLLICAAAFTILLLPELHDTTGIMALFFPQISRAVISVMKG